MLSKRKPIVLLVLLVAVAVLVLAWPLYPISAKRKVIAATSTTKWTEYQRLTKLLSLGMEPTEVERILGQPDRVIPVTNGQCTVYLDSGPTAGWTYVAEFEREGSTQSLKLCYVVNIQHVAFPDSPRFEMGKKLNLNEPDTISVFGLLNQNDKTN
jgi:hypothetical protein